MPLQGLALFFFSSFSGFITASVLHADNLDKQILHYAQQAYGSWVHFHVLVDMQMAVSHSHKGDTCNAFLSVTPIDLKHGSEIAEYLSHVQPFLRPRIFLLPLILWDSFPSNIHEQTRLWILISLISSKAISLASQSCCSFLNSLQLGGTVI